MSTHHKGADAPRPDIPIQNTATCPRCKGSNLATTLCAPGSGNHAETRCQGCGRHIRFEPAPWSLERARSFELYFGAHRGKTIGELDRTVDGRQYLRWLAGAGKTNASKAASIVLKSRTVESRHGDLFSGTVPS